MADSHLLLFISSPFITWPGVWQVRKGKNYIAYRFFRISSFQSKSL